MESDSMRRHLMVIRTFVIRRRQVRWHAETPHGYPHLCQPKASEPVDPKRPIWSFAPLVEDSMSIDWDYFILAFAIQRQSSPIACGGTSWLSVPSSFGDCKSDVMRRLSRLSVLYRFQGTKAFVDAPNCLLCSFFWQVSLIELLVGQVEIQLEQN